MKRYIPAGIIVSIVVLGIYQYAAVRYGVGGLSTLNKSLATSTLLLLGSVLLLGPLARMFGIFDSLILYRKEIGILTFYTGLAHVFISMFPLARNGPWGQYIKNPIPAFSGLFGLLIMALLLMSSLVPMKTMLGNKLWWQIQNWGARLAFLFITIHDVILKYSGWGPWFISRNPRLPPLSLLAAIFASFVIIVRLSDFFVPKTVKKVTQCSFIIISGFIFWLFLS